MYDLPDSSKFEKVWLFADDIYYRINNVDREALVDNSQSRLNEIVEGFE